MHQPNDALPSPGVNPLEGSPKCSCGKLGLGRRSRLPTLKKGRGSSWEPRDQTRKRDQLSLCESASKNQPREVSLAFGTPLGVGTSHGHLDTQDSPRPGLGSKSPPYSLQYTLHHSTGPTSKWPFCPGTPGTPAGLPRGSPETAPARTPATLKPHNFASRPRIATRSEAKLQLSSRAFQRYVARHLQPNISGRFPTISGRESKLANSREFDSWPFFCP